MTALLQPSQLLVLPSASAAPQQTDNCTISRRRLIAIFHATAAAISLSPPLARQALAAKGERVDIDDSSHDAGDISRQSIPISSQFFGDMHHQSGGSGRSNKEERPRFFDLKAKRLCWDKAKQVPGRDPERWRVDAVGNIVCKRLHTCNGCLCYEYDHIIPFSKGGESVEENCQILQTRVNRLKSNKNSIDQRLLKGYSCDINFSDEELDIIEMAVYGSVIRSEKNCIVGSISALLRKYKSGDHMIPCKSVQK